MIPQMIRVNAVYEDGVLKPDGGPVPNLTDGDRVEVVLVRVAPIDRDAPSEVERRERLWEDFREQTEALAAQPLMTPEEVAQYEEECRAFDEHRGEGRKLFPPELRGITW